MKKTLTALTLLASLCISLAPAAHAAGKASHEIAGASQGILFIPTRTGADTRFALDLGYNYGFSDHYQLGGQVQFTTGTGITGGFILIGPTFNFGSTNIQEAMFFGVQAGIPYGDFKTALVYFGAVGKRFQITQNAVWRPNVSMLGTTASNGSPTIAVIPIEFSLFY